MKAFSGRAPGFALLALVMVGWELLSRGGVIDKVFLPPFTQILFALGRMTWSGELPRHTFHTLGRCLVGYLLACAIAVPAGIAIGRWRFVRSLFEPLIELLRPLPSAAVIPVAILFLGIYTKMKLAVIVFGSLWPILINTMDGVSNIDPVLLDTGRTLSVRGRRFITKIIVPGASPGIVTGMRVSLAIALILSITVEMIAGSNGLGFYILDWERSFHFKEMYAGIFALGIVGYLLNYMFVQIDKRIMKWHKGFTSSSP